jgi:hypothetical protein
VAHSPQVAAPATVGPLTYPLDPAAMLARIREAEVTHVTDCRLDRPDDLAAIPRAMDQAWRSRAPVALLVGAPAAEPA